MSESKEQAVRAALRQVRWPGYETDVLAAGFVRSIAVEGPQVTVEFAPRTRSAEKVTAMERQILGLVGGVPGVEQVRIRRTLPVLDPVLREGGTITPLQAEVRDAGVVPEPDPMPGAKATWDGRRPGRSGPPMDTAYTGELPVFQWQIDPTNPAAESGESYLLQGDWEYRLWWQVHAEGLVYASIQAIEDDAVDHGAAARPHPVGRAVAVNLVYDTRRRGVVAIYGTARDFRPFVEVFRQGFRPDAQAGRGRTNEGEPR